MTYRNSTALLTVLALAVASPALAGDMQAEKTAMTHDAPAFAQLDTNNDAKIDFTEFSNYVSQYGYTDVEAAQEFTRLANSESVITDQAYASMDMSQMKKGNSHAQYEGVSATQAYTTANTNYDSGAITSYRNDQMVVLGRTSVSGDFSSYDANRDGLVNFKEYDKAAQKNGVSSTAAAREFIQISNGQPQFDENAFNMIQYTSAPNYQPTQEQYISDTYVEQPTPAYTGETTTSYESESTSGAYTEPTYQEETLPVYEPQPTPETEYSSETSSGAYTVTEPSDYMDKAKDAVTDEYVAPGATDTKVWSETGESGAYTSKTDITVDPTTGASNDYGVDTDVKDPMESVDEAYDDAKDAVKETWEDTKEAASDGAEGLVDPNE